MTINNVTHGKAEGTDKYNYFRPNFCHMLLNYDASAKYHEAIKILEVFYSMSLGFVLFMSIIMVVSNVVQFLEHNPLIGRESMFVNFIETENPELSQKLERLSVRERRMSLSRERSRSYQFQTLELSDISKTDPTTKAADQIRPQHTQSRSRSSSIDKKAQGMASDETIGQLATSAEQPTKTGETVQGTQVDAHSNKNGKRSEKKRVSHVNGSRRSSNLYELVLRIKKKRSTQARRIPSDIPGTHVSLAKFLCCCECFRSRGKRIPRVSSVSV